MPSSLAGLKILIRGAGEMATGTACRLHSAGFRKLLMTEIDKPLTVRRMVSFSEALHERSWGVEGVEAKAIQTLDQIATLWQEQRIPILVDPAASSRAAFKPDVLLDAILAKKNLGTTMNDAPLVIAFGPGFCAGKDAHCVVETNRGHDLGRLILQGEAAADTGTPGDIQGHTTLRVLRSPSDGIFESDRHIGSLVQEGELIGQVAGQPVKASLNGVIRGLIRSGTPVSRRLKIGDIDPRGNPSYCNTISEKARAIGGTALEAILMRFNVPDPTNPV
ncbi:MAG: selenium-dependent molybdenum cofactor biosynthesis protein YqeB [Desulfomonilaceae bacterium]